MTPASSRTVWLGSFPINGYTQGIASAGRRPRALQRSPPERIPKGLQGSRGTRRAAQTQRRAPVRGNSTRSVSLQTSSSSVPLPSIPGCLAPWLTGGRPCSAMSRPSSPGAKLYSCWSTLARQQLPGVPACYSAESFELSQPRPAAENPRGWQLQGSPTLCNNAPSRPQPASLERSLIEWQRTRSTYNRWNPFTNCQSGASCWLDTWCCMHRNHAFNSHAELPELASNS